MNFSAPSGGSIPNVPSGNGVYSIDGKYFVAILSHQLRVYYVTTRQCVRTVDADLLGAVDIRLGSDPNYVLITKPYEIVLVNWKEKGSSPVSLGYQFPEPVAAVIGHFPTGILYITMSSGTFSIVFQTVENTQIKLYETPQTKVYALSNNKQVVAILNHSHEVLIVDLLAVYHVAEQANPEFPELSVNVINYNYKSPIVSLAVNDSNTLLALGSSSGPIQVIFTASNDNEKVLKWHIGPAKALCFSDNYLISGGDEKVLVIWQVDTDHHQFLPRLNGKIEKITIDQNKPEYYNLLLNMNDTNQYGVLVVSKTDLVSRLSLNSLRPRVAKKLSAKNSYSLVELNPKSNHLYLPNSSLIQTFDPVKMEQVAQQNLSPSVAMGKVKSELKLMDPEITDLKFSEDGDWMCTFDSVFNNDIDNLQGDSKTFALKFWKQNESWDLVTKIINPHLNNPVVSIMAYNSGFVTVDSKCNLRYWKYKNKSWYIVKTLDMSLPDSKFITTARSDDNSVVFVSYNNSIKIINSNFQLVSSHVLCDGNILALEVVKTDLMVLSTTKFISFDLVSFGTNFVGGVEVPNRSEVRSLVLVLGGLVGLVLNLDLAKAAKVLVFSPKSLTPVFVTYHDKHINSIKPYNNGFLFIDNALRIGYVNSDPVDHGVDMDLNGSKSTVVVGGEEAQDLENVSFKQLDINSFGHLFETENLETLFDNIIKIVK